MPEDMKPTICGLAQDIIDNVNDKDLVIEKARKICECGEAMEARLHAYCSSIEKLGFVRANRLLNK